MPPSPQEQRPRIKRTDNLHSTGQPRQHCALNGVPLVLGTPYPEDDESECPLEEKQICEEAFVSRPRIHLEDHIVERSLALDIPDKLVEILAHRRVPCLPQAPCVCRHHDLRRHAQGQFVLGAVAQGPAENAFMHENVPML